MPETMRYPAVPLIVHDPFFSVWSFSDRLTDDWSRHWSGINNAMCGMLRIDGRSYRYAGREGGEPMEQLRCEVLPTRTVYTFAAAGTELELTFLSPLLPDDLELLSRPLSYVIAQVRSTDGKRHQLEFYWDCGADWTVSALGQRVTGGRGGAAGLELAFTGTLDGRPLEKCGDAVNIDWGRLHLAVQPDPATSLRYQKSAVVRRNFRENGRLNCDDLLDASVPVHGHWPVCAVSHDFGSVGGEARRWHLAVAYDQVHAVELMRLKLDDYWKKDGKSFAVMLAEAFAGFEDVERRAAAFDERLLAECRRVGGENYALLCAAAYRQAVGAHKLAADNRGRALFFSKENLSNGCIATVDVTYPSAPLFLLVAPELLKGMLIPIMEYAASPRWKFPFAPHDLGTFPQANGQIYGGGEETEECQMPVEECGNMLILTEALRKFSGDLRFCEEHYRLLRQWADYLLGKGMDPESQLCTDDFAGHLAHNANLSLKAILGLGAFARTAAALGETEDAARFRSAAESFAGKWLEAADGGECTRLAFDRPGSWSQKYNLIWDKLLDLKLFPASLAEREVAFYRTHQNRYGLPLDSRETYTKLDWILYCACLTGDDEDFQALLAPVIDFLRESPSRVPMTDWYDTVTGRQSGFQARSVVGGLFIRLLCDESAIRSFRR